MRCISVSPSSDQIALCPNMLTPFQREILKWIIPPNFMKLLRTWRRQRVVRETSRESQIPGRFDYRKAVEWLVSKQCDRLHVLDGSMPPASLEFSWQAIAPA